MNGKRIAIIATSAALVVALVLGWSLWRKDTSSESGTKATGAATSQKSGTDDTEKTSEASTSVEEQNKDLAIRFELAARNWGTDSTIAATDYNRMNASDVLNALRTPDLGDSPIADMISFEPVENAGPDATSYVCLESDYQAFCQFMPTAQSWWKNEAWGIGTRWIGEPEATVRSDGTIDVKGTVRTVLVTKGDTFSMNGYNALTPAWQDYEINDNLTIQDGKVASIRYRDGINHWWVNPWLNKWTPDYVAKNIAEGTRIAIPVSGTLNWDGMEPTSITPALRTPKSMGDMDGNVDWTMWNDLIQAGGTDASQQAPDLDPEKDAATIHERE